MASKPYDARTLLAVVSDLRRRADEYQSLRWRDMAEALRESASYWEAQVTKKRKRAGAVR
jgi:ribosomal protein L18E